MEDIINSILEIEKKGKERIDSAMHEKNQIIADAKDSEQKIINDCLSEIDNQLKELEDEKMKSEDNQLSVIKENMKKEIEHLDKIYSEKHNDWVEEIFSAIISN